MRRRDFLRSGLYGAGALVLGSTILAACKLRGDGTHIYGPLGAADANGLRLPDGFTSRSIATTGQEVASTGHIWHAAPDGGATFAQPDGGWIYVSNSEVNNGGGGVGMVRLSSAGAIVGAANILSGTNRNCAGGATPWGTWLSCEEVSRGKVYECDPTGASVAVALDGLGWFWHEAAAVDPVGQAVYLTEDRPDGGLYRFVAAAYPDLSAGTLEVLTDGVGGLGWAVVPDPNPSAAAPSTRYQVADIRTFNGGEGAWYYAGKIYFTTKGDNRVWTYTIASNALKVIYDDDTNNNPVLTGVDNVTVAAASGDVYVAEDGGNMQVCLIGPGGSAGVFAELTGVAGSEIAGVAFNPAGDRLYFSSQRNPGETFEVTGPFRGI